MPDLTTLDALKARLKIPADNSSANDDLAALITQTSADFHGATHRLSLLNCDYAERRDGQGGDKLVLRQAPLVNLTNLTVSGLPIPPSPDGVQPGYVTDASSATIALVGAVFVRGHGNVAVHYTAGFGASINDLPQEIVLAVLDWCEYRYRTRSTAGFASRRMSTGEAVTYEKLEMPETIRRVVEQYKRRVGIL